MPRFLFNLQTLLQHRESIEQKERDELLRLDYRFKTELRHRDGLIAKFREATTELSTRHSENKDHQELNWFYIYLQRLHQEIEESEKRLAQLGKEIQAQKEVVIEAVKKKKVLAALRVKKEREFITEMDKQEQKEVDDLVVTRYASREPQNLEGDGRRNSGTDVKHKSWRE